MLFQYAASKVLQDFGFHFTSEPKRKHLHINMILYTFRMAKQFPISLRIRHITKKKKGTKTSL